MKSTELAALATCMALASSTAAASQDTLKGETVSLPMNRTLPNELLQSLVGSWEGTCRTWSEPGTLADESGVRGDIRRMLDGRFLRHTYEGTIQGKPRHGEETIAFNSIANRFQVSWFDDFHMSYGIVFSEGEAAARGFVVIGSYDAAPNAPLWGRKTVYRLTDDDHLTITASAARTLGRSGRSCRTRSMVRSRGDSSGRRGVGLAGFQASARRRGEPVRHPDVKVALPLLQTGVMILGSGS